MLWGILIFRESFMDFKYHYVSPLGGITMACNDIGLTGLWFDGQAHFGSTLSPDSTEKMTDIFRDTAVWLDIYFNGGKPDFTPPMSLSSTPFRMAVWDILREIPYGKAMTYGEISRITAERLGKKSMSSQAVGGAVGHNPISLIIPCHRVIGADGSLTGYAGGIVRKIRLLELEETGFKKIC